MGCKNIDKLDHDRDLKMWETFRSGLGNEIAHNSCLLDPSTDVVRSYCCRLFYRNKNGMPLVIMKIFWAIKHFAWDRKSLLSFLGLCLMFGIDR